MKQKPNFMIVSGNGRNTGKTSFICEVIRKVSKKHAVTAIKVSPHFHDKHTSAAIKTASGYAIWEEKERDGIKDSSKMLLSGASQVFYIESKDNSLPKALDQLFLLIKPNRAVICESGGMRKFIEPSLFALLNQEGLEEKKQSYNELLPLADACVTFYGNGFNPAPEKVDFNGMKWMLRL